jgi:methylthioribulose-1-phosphate dehydratase
MDAIIEAGRRMHQMGWVPSIAGNLSVRLDAARIAITRSGGRKGALTTDSVIEVDLEGRPLVAGDVPSAETLLHCQLYAAFPHVGAVLHGHSVAATVLSRAAGETIELAGYEMLKAFDGIDTHEVRVQLPVFANDQDMRRLAGVIAKGLRADWIGYGLRGHGVYVWGRTMDDAMNKLEALEFILSCELAARSIGR